MQPPQHMYDPSLSVILAARKIFPTYKRQSLQLWECFLFAIQQCLI